MFTVYQIETLERKSNPLEYSKKNPDTLAPQVKNFVDYREFLRAWYDFQKSVNPQFSYAIWANKSGFKSRSFIRLVMLGKRTLGVDSIPLVLKSIGLHGEDSKYFTNLVHYAHSSNFESRDHYFNEILKLSKGTGSLVKDSYRFLAQPKTTRVHLLINLKGFKASAEAIATSLDLSITEVKEILENLVQLGLAHHDQDHLAWKGTIKNIKLPDELGNLALQSFHSHSLKEAQSAIQLAPSTRHYESLIFFLDASQYAEATKELKQFSDYMARKYQTASESHSSKIYQINLNLIPASKEIIRTQFESSCDVKDPEMLSDIVQEIEL